MKMQNVSLADDGAISSLTIQSASKGKWSHTLPLWTAHPDEMREIMSGVCESQIIEDMIREDGTDRVRFYLESISKKDSRTGKTGVRGPYLFSRVLEWQREGHYMWLGKQCNHRRIMIQELPVTSDQAAIALRLACRMVPIIKYAHVQIIQNWLGFRFGRGIPLNRRSRKKMTCVEFFVWLLAHIIPDWVIKYLDLGYIGFDEYCPSGTRGPGVYDMIENGRKKERKERKTQNG